MEKNVRFPNSAKQDRTEVAYATVPFKQGEWDGSDPLEVIDDEGNLIPDAWVYPFGKTYADGTRRYGALMARLSVPGSDQAMVKVKDATQPLTEPAFRVAPKLASSDPFSLHFSTVVNGQTSSLTFGGWKALESNGMRQVYESVGRLGDFVANLKIYLYSNQELMKWELDVTASNPSHTLRTYAFDELHFLVVGDNHFLNIRGASGRGVKTLSPFKHFKLMEGSQGFFGDGQKQSYYGELATLTGDVEVAYSATAAIDFPMWGMSSDWVDSGEAFGACQVVPDTPVPLPTQGIEAAAGKYVPIWRLMNASDGNPWDDYPDGLTKTPGQTGGQKDFGILEEWEVLHTGLGELVETVRFLATEDAKRPGHYLEIDGTHVTQIGHPQWVTGGGTTHWHFGVSRDRLGKTDPNALLATNGWVAKDWQHMSSNLLYIAALLTGSHALRDEQNHEVEYFLAGHTVPSEFPGWSTNGRGEPRGFGRTHLAILHHDTILDREDILVKMIDRFEQVVENQWTGANSDPTQPWSLTSDPRVFPNGQTAWVPWNNHLGWIGIYALWLATDKVDARIQQVMVDWGDTIINWGWRVNSDNSVNLGHGAKWLNGGAALTPAQMNDPAFWLPVGGFNQQWGLAVAAFAKDSQLFDASTRARAQQIWDEMVRLRMANYNPITNPFDTFGKWTAL